MRFTVEIECDNEAFSDNPQEDDLAVAKLEAWEPPSADDIADMKGGW